MIAFTMSSPVDVIRGLAARSNVSYGSLRFFEARGKTSTESVVKIAFAFEAESEFHHLFPRWPPQAAGTPEMKFKPIRQVSVHLDIEREEARHPWACLRFGFLGQSRFLPLV